MEVDSSKSQKTYRIAKTNAIVKFSSDTHELDNFLHRKKEIKS